jgi:hypothetical protein
MSQSSFWVALFILSHWNWIVVACLLLISAAAFSKLFLVLGERHAERQRAYARDYAATIARADYEHEMALLDEPDGLYGRYYPATMPMTGPMYPKPDWSTVIQYGGIE